MNFIRILWIIGWVFLTLPKTEAASCCGGGSSSIPILANDDRSMFRFTAQGLWTLRDADGYGRIVPRSESAATTQVPLQVAASTLLTDRLQMGATFRWNRRPGDMMFMWTYELVDAWTYQRWKPRVLAFFQVTAPTGLSTFETSNIESISGQGFWVFNLGAQIEKDAGNWILTWNPQCAFKAQRFGVSPGPVLSSPVQLGWRFGAWMVGVQVEPIYQSSRQVSVAAGTLTTQDQFQIQGGLLASVEVVDQTRIQAAIQDGAVFGIAWNQAIERSLSFSISHTILR